MLLELILKWMEDFKYRYLLYYGRYIVTSLGRTGRPGLAGAAGKDTSLTSWKEKHISVGKRYADIKLLWLLQGLPRFRRASNYNRKQANALASYGECLL
jgi:hypothetical protein